jgi:putative transposase
MGKRRFTPEEIIKHLRTLEIMQAKGETLEGFARSIGVHKVTICKWKKEYGGMQVSQAKKLKDLEKENTRLKKLLAESELEKDVLKEVVSGNY